MTLYQVSAEITRRLASIFLRNEHGRRRPRPGFLARGKGAVVV